MCGAARKMRRKTSALTIFKFKFMTVFSLKQRIELKEILNSFDFWAEIFTYVGLHFYLAI